MACVRGALILDPYVPVSSVRLVRSDRGNSWVQRISLVRTPRSEHTLSD